MLKRILAKLGILKEQVEETREDLEELKVKHAREIEKLDRQQRESEAMVKALDAELGVFTREHS